MLTSDGRLCMNGMFIGLGFILLGLPFLGALIAWIPMQVFEDIVEEAIFNEIKWEDCLVESPDYIFNNMRINRTALKWNNFSFKGVCDSKYSFSLIHPKLSQDLDNLGEECYRQSNFLEYAEKINTKSKLLEKNILKIIKKREDNLDKLVERVKENKKLYNIAYKLHRYEIPLVIDLINLPKISYTTVAYFEDKKETFNKFKNKDRYGRLYKNLPYSKIRY